MSTFRRSSIGSFTRGGQTTIHYLRMIWQVVTKFTMASVVAFLVLFALIFYLKTEHYQRYVTVKYGFSYVAVKWMANNDAKVPFVLENGREAEVYARAILANDRVAVIVNSTYQEGVHSIVYAFFASILLFLFAVRFIHDTGREQAKDEFVRGGQLVPSRELNKMIKRREEPGILKLAGVAVPKEVEPAHMLFNGGPGTGKSQLFKEALATIRKNKQRAIVYDISGDFVQAFYRKDKDIILNPLDARCALWDVWCEAKFDWDYESIAASLIPDKAMGNDPMWALAARIIFVELAKKIGKSPNPTNQKLTDLILKVTKEEVTNFLRNTDASALLDEDAERVIASIRTMLATYSRSLKYLPDEGKRFSIKAWAQDESGGDSWVFITSTEEQKETLKPLITVWIDVASSSILSLSRNPDRRIWLAIDELPTLNKVPSLLNTLTNSRKYGGCGIIGYQSYPQLVDIYGKHGADALCEACSTWAILRANGNETAEWGSKGLGSTEVLETTEGLSYGVNEIRDGVSLSRQRKLRPIILPTELNNLRNLHGYLKLGRDYPIGKFVLKYKSYPDIAPDFVLRMERPQSAQHEEYVEDGFNGNDELNDVDSESDHTDGFNKEAVTESNPAPKEKTKINYSDVGI